MTKLNWEQLKRKKLYLHDKSIYKPKIHKTWKCKTCKRKILWRPSSGNWVAFDMNGERHHCILKRNEGAETSQS